MNKDKEKRINPITIGLLGILIGLCMFIAKNLIKLNDVAVIMGAFIVCIAAGFLMARRKGGR